ncbi:DUF5069 domain-containing protein [bacterium]|nr:MAG: DUF5069 domain-containing protein [bacterium]
MTHAPAPDLRTAFPRAGRVKLGDFVWIARLADKVRAQQAGTIGDYTAYCEVSHGFLERCGVTPEVFTALIRSGASDEELVRYFAMHVDPQRRDAANRWVLVDNAEDLREQEREEGEPPA